MASVASIGLASDARPWGNLQHGATHTRTPKALLMATLLALLAHTLGWALWRQHAGGMAHTAPMSGSSPAMRLRMLAMAAPALHLAQAEVASVRAHARRDPQPVADQAVPRTSTVHAAPPARAPLPGGATPGEVASGPVVVESSFDEAMRAVSLRNPAHQVEGAVGQAHDTLSINPDAYWPADTLDQSPQLAGPWVLNEAAVPPRPRGAQSVVTIAMRLWVSAEGRIDAVQILSADPAEPWTEDLLRDIHETTLRPALQQGRAVASSWLVEWQLDLGAAL